MATGLGSANSQAGDLSNSAAILEEARIVAGDYRLGDAYELLTRADGERALSAEDLEL